MKTIRASEIGTYQYCQRAWWYKLQGYEPENKAEMAGGKSLHEKHGRVVFASSCMRGIAYASLMIAILIITVWIIQSIL